MPLDFAALKTEILTDPTGLGYAPLVAAGNHIGVAAALNLSRASIIISRQVIPCYDLFEAITSADYTALSAAERTRLQLILSMGNINGAGSNTRAQLAAMFGPATTTRANILALIDRQGSRAEQLFGAGLVVTFGDVGQALAS